MEEDKNQESIDEGADVVSKASDTANEVEEEVSEAPVGEVAE